MNLLKIEFNQESSEALNKLAKAKQTTVEALVAQWIESVKQEVKNGEWESLGQW